MKLTEANFQVAVKIGGLILALSAVGNLYLLLRYREVYRDASRAELVVLQQGATLGLQMQTLEAIIREFASRAQTDPGIADIFKHYQPTNAAKPAATEPQP
jgi:hypothetical protein